MTSSSTQHCATLTIDFLCTNCRSRKGFFCFHFAANLSASLVGRHPRPRGQDVGRSRKYTRPIHGGGEAGFKHSAKRKVHTFFGITHSTY